MSEPIFSCFPHESFFELSIYQFGYEQCRPLHMFGPAARSHFLFHFILSGKGQLMSIDDRGETHTYALTGGHGFMLWPNQITTYFADKQEPWEYVWIEFDGLKARELVVQSGLSYNYTVYNADDAEKREMMKNELMYIVTHAGNQPLELMGHFYLFIHHLIMSSARRKAMPGGNMRDFYVREAIAFIEQHYQQDIAVTDIARFCNLNRSYLTRIFKIVLESTPQDFLINYRMKKACELLKTGEYSVHEISAMVGYTNQLNFSRAFKREIGKSPIQWKKGI